MFIKSMDITNYKLFKDIFREFYTLILLFPILHHIQQTPVLICRNYLKFFQFLFA